MTTDFATAMDNELRRIESEAPRRARRERIALAAMQGLLADRRWASDDATEQSILARYAVQQADALIAALDGEGGQS